MFYSISKKKKISFNHLIQCQNTHMEETANKKHTSSSKLCFFTPQTKLWHPYWFPIPNQYQLCWYMSEPWLLAKWAPSTIGGSGDNTKHIIFTCMSAHLQSCRPTALHSLIQGQLPTSRSGIRGVYDSILAFINRILINSLCLVSMG